MMSSSVEVHKAIGLPEDVDPTHTYTFRSGEYGSFYQYWYADRAGNYWKYTNAPLEHEDHDPHAGEPLLDPEQPLPHTDPQFFTEEGYKRHIGVPQDAQVEPNEAYDPSSSTDVWFEKFTSSTGEVRYVYLDKDVKENLDLYVQHQLRVVDSGLNKYRQFAANLFQSAHPKDKMLAAILMLVDQGYYQVEELVNATVADIDFVDRTILLLGRKFVCDEELFDFLTSISSGRSTEESLFVLEGVHGKTPLGPLLLNATFAYLKVSSKFLLYWHATHMYSRIISHLALQGVPSEDAEDAAYGELARVFTSNDDIRFLVDYKVKEALISNYKSSFGKSFKRETADTYGVAVVYSDLVERKGDELEFSKWLHLQPLHEAPIEEVSDVVEPELGGDETEGTEEDAGAAAPTGAGEVEPQGVEE